jgi:hypothetical protein
VITNSSFLQFWEQHDHQNQVRKKKKGKREDLEEGVLIKEDEERNVSENKIELKEEEDEEEDIDEGGEMYKKDSTLKGKVESKEEGEEEEEVNEEGEISEEILKKKKRKRNDGGF